MGYTIRYEGTKAQMMREGLTDAKDWYGNKGYQKIMGAMTAETREKGRKWLARTYPILLGISGLSGVPARAVALEVLHRINTEQRLKDEGLWAE